jgi:Response receiver domain
LNLPQKKTDSETKDSETVKQTITSDPTHELDIQSLIEVFSDKGLICSVLRPKETELDSAPARVVKLACNADLLILDWVLFKSRGDTTIEIIKKIIDYDQGNEGRLRTIIIYTGEPDIHNIAEKIKTAINGNIIEADGGCTIEKDRFVRISVFAKDHINLPEHLINRKISIQNLPDKIISEFSKVTSGLVSNIALESLAILRENTHLLLARLHSEIDIPFLTHRALLPNPDDSAEHLVDLISAEIRSILDEYEVEKNANFDTVKMWLTSKNALDRTYTLQECGLNNLNQAQVLNLLEHGINNWMREGNELSDKSRKKIHKHISKMFCPDIDDARALDLDNEFAMITSLAKQESTLRFNRNNIIKLTLGTILQVDSSSNLSEDSNTYWLCIQPRCDSILRGEDKRFFPLLPLKIVTDNQFSIIVKNNQNKHVLLKLIDKVHRVKMECFISSSDNDSIIAQPEDVLSSEGILSDQDNPKAFFFKATDGTNVTRYRWIAELKRDHAQRIANNFASNLSRVGLNESEWLRRSAL